jgi:hypothetical protein
MFNTLQTSIRPLLHKKYTSPGVRLIFRQQIQPWHPSSTLAQKEYFDVNVVHESRNETYNRLAKLAAQVEGVDEGKVLELLVVSDKPGKDGGLNIGNGVTDDVKQMVKANRVIGAHVTPTVFFNGVEERSIGSSWTTEQWEEWLDKNVT